jgi:hypothetical protein
LESDIRFFRRRATEELAAASRAITEQARERRMVLAGVFLERLKAIESSPLPDGAAAFQWSQSSTVEAD